MGLPGQILHKPGQNNRAVAICQDTGLKTRTVLGKPRRLITRAILQQAAKNWVVQLVQTTFTMLLWRNLGAFTVSQQHMLRLHQSQIATGVLKVGQEQGWDQSHKLDLI